MRAIGKGSLASILAAGLHAVRIVIFIAFFGLSIAAVIMPFLPMLERVSDGIVSIDGGTVSGGDYVKLMSYFVSFGVMLFIVNRLLEILKTLRFGSPFVRENAVRFRQVGYALLLGEGAKIAFGILGAIFDAELAPLARRPEILAARRGGLASGCGTSDQRRLLVDDMQRQIRRS